MLVSATSLSRALYPRLRGHLGRATARGARIGSAWRWLAVVVVLALSLVARTRPDLGGRRASPRRACGSASCPLLCDLAVAVFVPLGAAGGPVAARLLVPGALLFAARDGLRPTGLGHLAPRALESSANHYGAIGVAFTYLACLYMSP